MYNLEGYKKYLTTAPVRGSGVISPSKSLNKTAAQLRMNQLETKKSLQQLPKPQEQAPKASLNILWPRQASPQSYKQRPMAATPELQNNIARSSASVKDSETEEQNKNLQAQIVALQKENKRIQQDFLTLFKSSHNSPKEQKFDETEQRAQAFSLSEKQKLEGQLQVQASKLRQMQFLTQERDILLERVTLMTEQLNRANKSTNERPYKEIQELVLQKQEIQEQNQQLVNENASLYKQLKQLVETVEALKLENNQLKDNITQVSSKDNQNSSLKKQNQDQELLIQQQQDQIKQLNVRIQNLLNENNKYQNSVLDQQNEVSQIMKQTDQLVKKNSILQTDIDDLQISLTQANKDRSDLQMKLNNSQSLIKELEHQITLRDAKVPDQDKECEAQILEQNDNTNNLQLIEELNNQIKFNQEHIQEMIKYTQEGEEICISQKQELVNLRQMIASKDQIQHNCEYDQTNIKEKLDDLEQYIQNGEQQLLQDKIDSSQLKKQIEKLELKLQSELGDKKLLEQKNEHLEQQIQDLRDYIQNGEQEYLQQKILIQELQYQGTKSSNQQNLDVPQRGVKDQIEDLNQYIEEGEQYLIQLKQDLSKKDQDQTLGIENQKLKEQIQLLSKTQQQQQDLIQDLQLQLDQAETYYILNQGQKGSPEINKIANKDGERLQQQLLEQKQQNEELKLALDQAEETIILKNLEINKLKKTQTQIQPTASDKNQIQSIIQKLQEERDLVDSGELMIITLKLQNQQFQVELLEQNQILSQKEETIEEQSNIIGQLKKEISELQDYVEMGEQIFQEVKIKQKNSHNLDMNTSQEYQECQSTQASIHEEMDRYISEGEETIQIYKSKQKELQNQIQGLTKVNEVLQGENNYIKKKLNSLQQQLDEEKNYADEAEGAYLQLLQVFRESQKKNEKKKQ